MKPIDIAVAGCGPCGLAAALMLARDGHRVTLFERFAAPRPLGSGLMLQPTGLAVLATLGLADAARQRGARIGHLLGITDRGRIVLDVRYRALGGTLHGIGIHRASLFALLHEAVAAAGLPVETGREIVAADAAVGRRTLRFADGGRAGPFDLVVDALGTRTPLAPACGRALAYGALWANVDWCEEAGFDAGRLEQRYRRARRMAGVLPIGTPPGAARRQAALFWSIRADAFARWQAEGLAAWRAEVLALWPALAPLVAQIERPEQLTFARYAHRTVRRPGAAGLVHLGDAWHSASPQLGQGANMALLDAHALRLALRDGGSVAEAIAGTIRLRQRHVRLYQALTALFTPVYQSDGRLLPALRDRLVAPLSRVPPGPAVQAAMVAGLIGRPLAPLGLEP